MTDKEAKSHAKEKFSSAQDLDGSLNQGEFGMLLFFTMTHIKNFVTW